MKWCGIAADTALRFWKFQRKSVLNNYFCLLQSAQILLLYWSLWVPQTVPERLTGHLKAHGWLVPVHQSLVTDGSCFSNSLYVLHLPTPQFSLPISLLFWMAAKVFFFSMMVSSVVSLGLFHIFTTISAFPVPALLGLPGTWQDEHHHHMTQSYSKNQPCQGTGCHLSVPASGQFVLPGFVPQKYWRKAWSEDPLTDWQLNKEALSRSKCLTIPF